MCVVRVFIISSSPLLFSYSFSPHIHTNGLCLSLFNLVGRVGSSFHLVNQSRLIDQGMFLLYCGVFLHLDHLFLLDLCVFDLGICDS